MKTFPMFLQMAGRLVVIAGGGEQAAQKARLMLKTEARLRVVAAQLEPELAGLVASGRAEQVREATVEAFAGAALVFIATGDAGRDTALHAMAKAAGCLVNVVDRPDLCDAVTPSIVDRDPVVVAIGTEGNAPVLGRQIKTQIEQLLEPNLGGLAALAGRMRSAVAGAVPHAQRRALWDWVFAGPVRAAHARGGEREAARMLKEAIAQGQAPDETGQGHIALVGAGPGARDLLTLRAVQRLQQADVIFYDRLVDPEVMELARRDAQRIYVGKTLGAHEWPQERIDAVIIAAARQGQRVVRLKSGDPSLFGRAEEELRAAHAAGIPVEIIPGVTAASAAAASLGRAMTERGATDHLILATATARDGVAAPDIAAMARPGATLALYMAVRQLPRIRADLLAAGWPETTEVEAVASASTAHEVQCRCTLGDMDRALADVANPAIIFLRFAKDAVAMPQAPQLHVVSA
ncbi:siroheme synthase CysG [Pararhodobacter zhoushanensis]|uniref:siroheme synthase CysG n=1 Tax=Pararhodobacter zhoushanensis TaxID=2479545 RepID=UPI000F8E6FE2|nr:siroheme synthase CysG [Pararhodobacter zhoushanensis]